MMDNNTLAIAAVFLLVVSVIGNYMVLKKVDMVEDKNLKRITGRVSSGFVNLTIHRSLEEIDLYAVLEPDDKTVTIYWQNIGQDNTSIFISSDADYFDYMNPNVTLDVFNWTDPTSDTAPIRYYRVGVNRRKIFNLTRPIAGKYQIEIKEANGIPTSFEMNQISLPLIPYDNDFENIVRQESNGDVILRFNTSDLGGTFAGWETNLKMGPVWFKQFDKWQHKEGYVFISVANPYNLTFVGQVPEGDIVIPMLVTTGSPAGYEMMLLGWNSLRTECNLKLALNTTEANSVLWFDPTVTGSTYEGWQVMFRMGNNWFPGGECMRPGYGYRFPDIDNEYNWTYNRTL